MHRMINEANFEGSTPLHYAATSPNIAGLKKLRDYGAVIHKNNKGWTPIMCACSEGNFEDAKLLYSRGIGLIFVAALHCICPSMARTLK